MSESSIEHAVAAQSSKSLPTRSVASHSGTSGVHDTDTPADIQSLLSVDIELGQYKTPGSTTSKSQSHRETHSADVHSDTRSQVSTGYGGSPISPCRTRSIPPSRQSFRRHPDEMTDFEREFFSEDYMSGDEDDDENFINSLGHLGHESESVMVDSVASEKYKDFLRCLPVHLSKRILGMLDKNSLTNCLCLSKHWRVLAEEVKSDYMVHQIMTEEIMLMQVSFTTTTITTTTSANATITTTSMLMQVSFTTTT